MNYYTHSTKTKTMLMVVSSLSGAGFFGVMNEIFIRNFVPNEFKATAILFMVGLALLCSFAIHKVLAYDLYDSISTDRTEYIRRVIPKNQLNTEIFEVRMRSIQTLANRNMKRGEFKNGIPHLTHILVPYQDLLRIWDIAQRAEVETPVEL